MPRKHLYHNREQLGYRYKCRGHFVPLELPNGIPSSGLFFVSRTYSGPGAPPRFPHQIPELFTGLCHNQKWPLMTNFRPANRKPVVSPVCTWGGSGGAQCGGAAARAPGGPARARRATRPVIHRGARVLARHRRGALHTGTAPVCAGGPGVGGARRHSMGEP